MTSDVINLVTASRSQDTSGIWTETSTSRQVFCQVTSISASEFFEAAQVGHRPELRFTIFAGDYAGENELTYKGTAYGIYRTYRAGDRLELYAETKAGVTHG